MTESRGSGQPHSALLPVGTLLSDYHIVKKLANGGPNFVYLTTDEYGTPAAVKEYLPSSLVRRASGGLTPVVPKESASVFRLGLKYFFEEGQLLAKISYPAIVRMFNFLRENSIVYMMMTYEQGKTLQEHILVTCQQGRLRVLHERFTRRVFHDLVSGLREVRIHRLLHLDIKLGNIYPRGDFPSVLLDSGAAQQTLTTEASRFQPVYTPGFVTPELYRKHNELGPWVDIYSIGATTYACMTGTPLQGATQREKDDKLEESLEYLRKVYTASLIDLVDWRLKMKSEEHPQSMLRLQEVLREESNVLTGLQALIAITQDGPVPGEKEMLATHFMSQLLRRRGSRPPSRHP